MKSSITRCRQPIIIICTVVLFIMLSVWVGLQCIALAEDELVTYQKLIMPFNYQLGSASWENTSELDPDALIVYYLSLHAMGEIVLPAEGPVDEHYGNPLLEAARVEHTIQEHFDVSTDFLRSSNYYDSRSNSYFSGGIGSTSELELQKGYLAGSRLTLIYVSKISGADYNASWKGKVHIELTNNGGYRYLSFEKYAHREKYSE